jgi:acyl carrier protein
MTRSAFAELIQEEIGLDIGVDDLAVGFDQLPQWDSVHLLAIIVTLEKASGKRLSLPDFLSAGTLADIYELVRE